MSKGSRQNGFVPLVKRLALRVRYAGRQLKLVVWSVRVGGLIIIIRENVEK